MMLNYFISNGSLIKRYGVKLRLAIGYKVTTVIY
jgi:hypothetical protein